MATLYELKPCPFCGGKAEMLYGGADYYYGKCTVCGVDGIKHKDFELAIEAWNRRSYDHS